MKKQYKDIVVVGFALFAMFFGAGNLIFPPHLGLISGGQWLIGFAGFLFADVGLALVALAASAKMGGDILAVYTRAGKTLAVVLASLIMICLGPLIAIPRTGATTFEMGMIPLFPGFNAIIFAIIFFGLTCFLTIKPSKVVDIIGAYLTPALLICLIFMIIKGVITPIGAADAETLIDSTFAEGIAQGYQTMDALGATALSTVVIVSIGAKGYTGTNEKVGMTIKSGFLAGFALMIIYGGLTYLGSTYAHVYAELHPGFQITDINQTALIVSITEAILGNIGKIMLAIIVSLACLTTSIGLTSAASSFFNELSKGKVKYEHLVIGICIFAAVVSNFGVSQIISLAAPILSVIYPCAVILSILTLFGDKIKNDNVFKGAAYVAILFSLIQTVAPMLGANVDVLNSLPLGNFGFAWVVPTLIGAIVGNFIPSKSNLATVQAAEEKQFEEFFENDEEYKK